MQSINLTSIMNDLKKSQLTHTQSQALGRLQQAGLVDGQGKPNPEYYPNGVPQNNQKIADVNL